MPFITLSPSGAKISAQCGELLLDALKGAGHTVDAPCGGHGVCGRCLIRIISGSVEFENNGRLSDAQRNEGYVLACKARLGQGDITVQLQENEAEQGKFTAAYEDMRLVPEYLLPLKDEINPLVMTAEITVAEPAQADGLSDCDRFIKAAEAAFGTKEITLPLDVLKALPEAVRHAGGKISAVYLPRNSCISIVDIAPAIGVGKNFGIAVDIGTTTVAVQLTDTLTGRVLASKTDYNGQTACGLDVISRINYCRREGGLSELQGRVLDTVNSLIGELALKQSIEKRRITCASVAGNTTMIHLLLGIVPEYIRIAPYTPAVYDVPLYSAGEIGLDINRNAPVYIAPAVGSYVGGDITSGLLCTELAAESEELCLFIDIGTNGEIILGNSDFLLGCACSAGPAFEGGGIEYGMRASNGAIEHAEADEQTGRACYNVIGSTAPKGICGSGLIALIADLFKKGFIDAAGKLDRSRQCDYIKPHGRMARYTIVPATESAHGKEIYITEADIDNFIRAKAAIFSACAVLLGKVELDFKDLARVYIAGGFGRYLNISYASAVGLLPQLPEDRYRFIGNSSLTGAYMTLISEKHRHRQRQTARRITYIDLSDEPEYMHQYTAALFLPHTDAGLFK